MWPGLDTEGDSNTNPDVLAAKFRVPPRLVRTLAPPDSGGSVGVRP